jgi:ankyrin repeat protein
MFKSFATSIGYSTCKRGKVNINQQNHVGLTALHQAVLSNNLDAVKMLLTHGSNVNAQDMNGFSPLHTASACGFIQILSLLVIYGADVISILNNCIQHRVGGKRNFSLSRRHYNTPWFINFRNKNNLAASSLQNKHTREQYHYQGNT